MRKKIKVVSFIFRSLEFGGAEKQLLMMAKELVASGMKVYINVFYYSSEILEKMDVGSEVEIVDLKKRGRWDLLYFMRSLFVNIKEQQPDIIYSFLISSNIFSSLLSLIYRRSKVVWGVRASVIERKHISFLSSLLQNISSLFSQRADSIIFNSQSARAQFVNSGYNRKKSSVVYNAVDTSRFVPGKSEVLRSKIIVGMVCRADPIKNIESLIRAADILNEKGYTNIEYRITGPSSGEYYRYLVDLTAELGLSEKFIWEGMLERPEEAYRNLDIFISCSHSESFSNSILEAMSSALVCIVSNTGDSADIVSDSGVVLNEVAPDNVADAIERVVLLPVSERMRLGRMARERVKNEYSVSKMMGRTLELFYKLCDS